MLYRPTEANGDMRPVTRKADLLTGSRAVSAACASRLRLFRGEWWEDADEGNPLLDMLTRGDKRDQSPAAICEALSRYIAGTRGVASVTGAEGRHDRPGRTVIYRFSYMTEHGENITQEVAEDALL
jgi:hypothetical protein